MDFRYYYQTDYHYKMIQNRIGHIKIPNKKTTFFCGSKKFENTQVETWALPSRKLCEQCVRERDRLIDRRPTSEQLRAWWFGGMAEHRKEIEILMS